MGFDMDSSEVVNGWMTETIAFALLSRGGEVDEEDVHVIIRDKVIGALMPQPDGSIPYKLLIQKVLEVASGLLVDGSRRHRDFGSSAPVTAVQSVNVWMLKTMAAVNVAIQHPYTHENLELQCQSEIVDGVQGNRRRLPTRSNLDVMVQKTINRAKEKLG